MSVCDVAKALLNINQKCALSANLARLSTSLPIQSDGVTNAIEAIDEAILAAPNALRDLNSTILGAAGGAQNLVFAARQLDPLKTVGQVVRDQTAEINNIARGMIRVVDSLSCVSQMITGRAIPGLAQARACMNDVLNKIDSTSASVQQQLGRWDNAVNRAIDVQIDQLQGLLNAAYRDFAADHKVVACLSSAIQIPDEIIRTSSSVYSEALSQLGQAGEQSGGCSGVSKQVSDLLDTGIQDLNSALLEAIDLNSRTQTAVTAINNFASTVAGPESRQLQQAVSTITQAPFTPAAEASAASASAAMSSASSQASQAAQQASITQTEFTFGHEVLLSRTGDIVKITHKNGSFILFDPAGNIHLHPNGVVFSKTIVPIV